MSDKRDTKNSNNPVYRRLHAKGAAGRMGGNKNFQLVRKFWDTWNELKISFHNLETDVDLTERRKSDMDVIKTHLQLLYGATNQLELKFEREAKKKKKKKKRVIIIKS